MNNALKDKIKEARLAKGLSQEGLADLSNISLRTIQRIEKGMGSPRVYTIKILAKHLDIDIANFGVNNATNLNVEIATLKKMNISIILTLIIPLFNILTPLTIWKTSGTLKELKQHGGKIISFQIIWTVATVFLFFLGIFVNNLLTGNAGNGIYISLIIYFLCLTFNAFVIVKSTNQLNNKNDFMVLVPNLF